MGWFQLTLNVCRFVSFVIKLYLNKAIMEKETDGCRNSDKSLFEFLLNCISNDVLDIWADVGIEVLL